MMHLLSTLITHACEALYDVGVLDWYPDENPPDAFVTECDIEISGYGDYSTALVTLLDRTVFLGRFSPNGDWHVSLVL